MFFTETAAKSKRDPDVVHVLRTATDFSKWIPEATRIRTEAGIHHSCNFSVYQVTYQGQTIEFKCKITDGELLYMMKFIKTKKRRKWSFRSLHILRCRHVKCLLHCIFTAKVQKNPLLPTKVADFFFPIKNFNNVHIQHHRPERAASTDKRYSRKPE